MDKKTRFGIVFVILAIFYYFVPEFFVLQNLDGQLVLFAGVLLFLMGGDK